MPRFFREQRDHPDARWSLSDDFSVVHSDAGAGELVVAGVFLRLFIASPGWVLRKPRDFMVELLEKWAQLVSQSNRNVSQILWCLKMKTMNCMASIFYEICSRDLINIFFLPLFHLFSPLPLSSLPLSSFHTFTTFLSPQLLRCVAKPKHYDLLFNKLKFSSPDRMRSWRLSRLLWLHFSRHSRECWTRYLSWVIFRSCSGP